MSRSSRFNRVEQSGTADAVVERHFREYRILVVRGRRWSGNNRRECSRYDTNVRFWHLVAERPAVACLMRL